MTDLVALLGSLVQVRSDLGSGGEPVLASRLGQDLAEVGADEVSVVEVPRPGHDPTAYVFARFGRPKLLVNAHLDTVPPNNGWTASPFDLRIDAGRVYGLGACDIKGAIAAIVAALETTRPHDTAILFSGDEEHGNAAMVAFLASDQAHGLEHAIVCEPTSLSLGTRHRGVIALESRATSIGGHSSRADRVPAPLADLSRLAVALDDFGRAHRDRGPSGYPGLCMNIGRLDGGIAFNVIPTEATLSASLRPPPGASMEALEEEILALARRTLPDATTRFTLSNAPFGTRDPEAFRRYFGDRANTPIDLGFWTEAALLSNAGIDAVVFGPGDIAYAHSPDEWVPLAELESARDHFVNVFRATHEGRHGTI